MKLSNQKLQTRMMNKKFILKLKQIRKNARFRKQN